MRRSWRIGLVILLAIGGALLVAGFLRGVGQAHVEELRVEPLPLVLACALGLAYWLLGAVSWWATLYRLGERLSVRSALGVFFVGNLGRYVPGKVWFALGRTYLAHQRGVAVGSVATSVVLELALITVSGAVITAAAAPSVTMSHASPVWFGTAVVVGGLLALHPRVLTLALAAGARVCRAPAPSAPSYRAVLPLLVAYTVTWLVAGVGLFATLGSLTPVTWDMLPAVCGVWGIAFLTGFAAPVAPAGVGAREAAGTLLLATLVPVPTAAAAMVLFRLILTGAEVVCVAPHAPTLLRALRSRP